LTKWFYLVCPFGSGVPGFRAKEEQRFMKDFFDAMTVTFSVARDSEKLKGVT
jgi:hypothetical protein